MKAKHLEKALMQFAEEGAAKVFKPMIGSGFIVGVVGQLLAACSLAVFPLNRCCNKVFAFILTIL